MCCSRTEEARKLAKEAANGGFVPRFVVIPCESLSAGSDAAFEGGSRARHPGKRYHTVQRKENRNEGGRNRRRKEFRLICLALLFCFLERASCAAVWKPLGQPSPAPGVGGCRRGRAGEGAGAGAGAQGAGASGPVAYLQGSLLPAGLGGLPFRVGVCVGPAAWPERPGGAWVAGEDPARRGELAHIWDLFGERHVAGPPWLRCAVAEKAIPIESWQTFLE